MLAVTESCLQGSSSPDARRRAIAAVKLDPRNLEGGYCNPWEQLMTLERNTDNADGTMFAMQAWQPWNSYAWAEPALRSEERNPAALRLLQRAHVLAPHDAFIADKLAVGLLVKGDIPAARSVADDVARGGRPLHDIEQTIIQIRISTSEALFGEALKQALKTSEIGPKDEGWVKSQRFEIGWHALEIAILLEQPHEIADVLVQRFIDAEPSPLDGNFEAVPKRLPAICLNASAPRPCLQRLRSLKKHIAGASTPQTEALLKGAELYVQGDMENAAKQWRPLIVGDLSLALQLPEAMTDAFSRTGNLSLAEEVDQEVMKRAGEFNGATLGHVRAAKRALDLGHRSRAQQLANDIVKAWAHADEPPPALAAMTELSRMP
jgi:hypothetical protein